MKGKVIILHGRQFSNKNETEGPMNKRHWIDWLYMELKFRKYEVYAPLIENDWEVNYDDWKEVIEGLGTEIEENTTLVATSAGAAFFVRYLGETGKKIKALILIAPCKLPSMLNMYDLKSGFWDFKIDTKIRDRVKKIVVYTSDNEIEKGKEDARLYAEKLNAELIELEGRGHFTIDSSKENKRIREALDYIIELEDI